MDEQSTVEKGSTLEVEQGESSPPHPTEGQTEYMKTVDTITAAPGTSTMEMFAHLDEKKILRKADIRLIPLLSVLYLLSFLDRGNIGNAKIEGLQEDLNMQPNEYNWCLTAFFFTYAAFEVPSNLMLKRTRPSIWIPSIMVAWGVVMTLMGIVQSYKGLLVARLFLGITEAGLFPGVAFYLTMWYCRHEIQFRQALFFSAASIAGAFSGLLAFAISKMDGIAGLAGWRWIFILEGLVTVVVAAAAYFLLHDFPETAKFLTEEERAFIVFRIKYQGQIAMNTASDTESPGAYSTLAAPAQAEDTKWKYVRDAFVDWQVWVNILVFWGIACPLYGISLFLPTIIRTLGYTSSTAQLMTVPIYITAALLAVGAAYSSDKVGMRSPFVIGFMFMILIGFVMCISSSNPHVIYGGVFIAACGLYPAFPGMITWLSNNLAGSYKRGAGMALQMGIGNLSGAMASNFYRQTDAPRFILGHGLEIGFVTIGIIASCVLLWRYRAENHRRARLMTQGIEARWTIEELSAQGDRAVTYRYMY